MNKWIVSISVALFGVSILLISSFCFKPSNASKIEIPPDKLKNRLLADYEIVEKLNSLTTVPEELKDIKIPESIILEGDTYYIDYTKILELYSMDNELKDYLLICDASQRLTPNVRSYYKVMDMSIRFIDTYPTSEYVEYCKSLIQLLENDYFGIGDLFFDEKGVIIEEDLIYYQELAKEDSHLGKLTKSYYDSIIKSKGEKDANVIAKGIECLKLIGGE